MGRKTLFRDTTQIDSQRGILSNVLTGQAYGSNLLDLHRETRISSVSSEVFFSSFSLPFFHRQRLSVKASCDDTLFITAFLVYHYITLYFICQQFFYFLFQASSDIFYKILPVVSECASHKSPSVSVF